MEVWNICRFYGDFYLHEKLEIQNFTKEVIGQNSYNSENVR